MFLTHGLFSQQRLSLLQFCRGFLRELIPLRTMVTIFVYMVGIVIIFNGSFGGSSLLGDGDAFLNSCTVAGFYVVLRKIKSDNIFPPLGAGYVIGSLAVAPFAKF